MTKNYRILLFISAIIYLIIFISATSFDNSNNKNTDYYVIYVFDIMEDIMPGTWRKTQQAFDEAEKADVHLILIHLNTYGGMVDAADSIRTRILNCKIPVYAFIDNNAASAGALISIACQKIYMRKGASIGAATVVTQSGEQAPDKYQAYMRSIMRATAEAHGHDTIITGTDTVVKWKRDPKIAEAMVDPDCYIEGVIDSGKVLSLTAEEAIKFGFCEGQAENIPEVLQITGFKNYKIIEYKPTVLDKLIGYLMNPVLQGLFIMLIVAGIYFELQSPGIGLPLIAAICGALLYFAPLYLEGLAEYWEILVFVAGLILLGIEIFAIPGFGVTGITGIVLVVAGLTLSLINNVNFNFEGVSFEIAFKSLCIVVVSMLVSFLLSIYLGKKLLTESKLSFLVLNTTQDKKNGYIGVESGPGLLVGKTAITATVLRPSGKIIIDSEMYDATSMEGYIGKDENVDVIKYETGQLYVRKSNR